MAERIVKQIRPRCKVPSLPKEIREKRVAAYARVSTDSDEQMGSVEAQKDYFEKLIREKPGWVLVGVYADEGISGTSLNHREAFVIYFSKFNPVSVSSINLPPSRNP